MTHHMFEAKLVTMGTINGKLIAQCKQGLFYEAKMNSGVLEWTPIPVIIHDSPEHSHELPEEPA